MSTLFEDVSLKWDGKTYKIPANRMMGAIARVEDIITLTELRNFHARGGAPIGKLSMAFGAMLRYAGAEIADEEIYLKMADSSDQQAVIMLAMKNVLLMMVPPNMRKAIVDGIEASEGKEPGKEQVTDTPRVEEPKG